jgi:hypothetical protein
LDNVSTLAYLARAENLSGAKAEMRRVCFRKYLPKNRCL